MFSIPSMKERDTNTENFGRVKIPLCMTQLGRGNKYFFAFESRCVRGTYWVLKWQAHDPMIHSMFVNILHTK